MMVVEWVMMTMMMIGRWMVGLWMMQQGLPEEEPKCAASILPAPTTSSALSYSRRLQAFSQPVQPTWSDQFFPVQPTWVDQFFPHNLFTNSSSLTNTTAPHCPDHSPRQFEHIGKQQTRFKPHYTPCVLCQPLRSKQQGLVLFWIKSHFLRLHLFLSRLPANTRQNWQTSVRSLSEKEDCGSCHLFLISRLIVLQRLLNLFLEGDCAGCVCRHLSPPRQLGADSRLTRDHPEHIFANQPTTRGRGTPWLWFLRSTTEATMRTFRGHFGETKKR